MTVRLTKISEAKNPLHPNNIEVGFEKTGVVPDDYKPTKGDSYWIGYWATSQIQSIISESAKEIVFQTFNSIYKLEIL